MTGMEKEEKLKKIASGLQEIGNRISLRIDSYNEVNLGAKDELESLQLNLKEIEDYVNQIKGELEEEENIFFLGAGSREKQQSLKSHEREAFELTQRMEELTAVIAADDEKISFMSEVLSKLSSYGKSISSILEDKREKKSAFVEGLEQCRQLARIDPERCYVELDKLRKEVEQWETS